MDFNPAQITFNSFKEMYLCEQCEQLVMAQKVPQCARCFGTNWIDLGPALLSAEETKNAKESDRVPDVHLYECGGGVAHTDPNDMKNGCGRVIRATPEEMSKEGQI
jgi:hypothetical protein